MDAKLDVANSVLNLENWKHIKNCSFCQKVNTVGGLGLKLMQINLNLL